MANWIGQGGLQYDVESGRCYESITPESITLYNQKQSNGWYGMRGEDYLDSHYKEAIRRT